MTHGYNRYRKGCRCDECKSGNTAAAREYAAKRRASGKPIVRARPSPKSFAGSCELCGTTFTAQKPQRFCSRKCFGRASRNVPCTDLIVYVGTKRDAPQTPTTVVTGPKWWAVIVAGPCAWCGENFVGVGRTTLYCSRRCQRQRAEQARGIKFRISPIVRRAIYERDDWTCQLCNGQVDTEADPASDWFPSLDHIEPQSHALIPDHSPSNLRTAHRWCNAVRGDGRYHTDLFAAA